MDSKRLIYKRRILKRIDDAGLIQIYDKAKITRLKAGNVFSNSMVKKELKKFAKSQKSQESRKN